MLRRHDALQFLCLSLGLLVEAHEKPLWQNGHYPYEDLISETVAYCYTSIVRNSSCCLDSLYAPGVRKTVVRRVGVGWWCGKSCYDDKKGYRGDDLLWVPEGATCESPRLLWIHGGSWEYGSPDTYSYGQLASKLAGLSGAVVMVPDFPLAPVGTYQVVLRACLDALRWLAEAPLGDLHCPPGVAPLLVGGDSAGGGTAMSLTLKLKESGGWSPKGIRESRPEELPGGQILAGAVFFSPWTNLKCDTPDYYYNAFAKIVDKKAFKDPDSGVAYVGDLMFRGHPQENLDEFTVNAKSYVGDDDSLLTDPLASPFFASVDELGGGGIPPLFFAVGGSESILGDSMILAQKAAFYGTSVHVDVHVGMWHDFPMYSEGCGSGVPLWQAARALNRTAAFIKYVAAAKQTATRLGLIWPPTTSIPGTPHTRYIYDTTRPGAARWFPKEVVDEATAPLSFADGFPEMGPSGKAPLVAPDRGAYALLASVGLFGTLISLLVYGICVYSALWRERIAPGDAAGGPPEGELDSMISALARVMFMTDLLVDHSRFTNGKFDGGFDQAGFLAKCSETERPFLKELTSTQMWASWISRRLLSGEDSKDIVLFDEVIAQKLNRKTFMFSKTATPFLSLDFSEKGHYREVRVPDPPRGSVAEPEDDRTSRGAVWQLDENRLYKPRPMEAMLTPQRATLQKVFWFCEVMCSMPLTAAA
ncbi:est [Symbiodinium sp. CCMP2456]|nr:est [Symbiodinium sp. CCMP2456]